MVLDLEVEPAEVPPEEAVAARETVSSGPATNVAASSSAADAIVASQGPLPPSARGVLTPSRKYIALTSRK